MDAGYPSPMMLTIVNNCPFTIYPGILGNAGHTNLEKGGFRLPALSHRSFNAPTHHWSGRIWARTGCCYTGHHKFTCETGDCGGRVECNGIGGKIPATLAQIQLQHPVAAYSVSLVDGFNLPMTITPHEGKGKCPVLGCRDKNLLKTCPRQLQVKSRNGKTVVGCKSGCAAYGTDKLCCRNRYNSARTCKASSYSLFFKKSCPSTFTYAHDTPSLTHQCYSPKELKVIFCH